VTTRTLTIGTGTYPLVLPNVRDPRLHVAAVIISVHVLGQVGLGFWVSIPQILAAIVTCWVLEVAITFRGTKSFVWPASAMLTGSGVALILRVVGTPVGDPWSLYAVEIFAVVAGLSLLSKYVIKYRGSHVFNPSNVGLVVAFVLLGSSRVEPLDFWWAPLTNPAMLLAYAVIIVGGLLITRRLRLLGLAASFWLALAAGVGLLAASGHCINTRWSFAPVCGADFARTIVTSPEVLIFLFFMITDPKTVPTGRVGRVVFGVLVAVVSTLLMAPQTDEFWTKVGLLAGLVIVSAARPIIERFVPEPRSEDDDLRRFGGRLLDGGNATAGGAVSAARAGLAAVVVIALGAGIVAAGTPARGFVVADSSEVLNRLPQQVDPATIPAVSVGQDVVDFDPTLAGPGMQEVVVTLAQNLALENQAMLGNDATILEAVDHGDRLAEMRERLQGAWEGSIHIVVLEHYRFETLSVRLLIPFGVQDGFSLGLDGAGTMLRETYDGDGRLLLSEELHFANTFAVRRATGARWLTVAVLPPGTSSP
jgi:Na+-translocating ferredoxin:NAD+ oxidoreductase RnfD subunit